MPSHTRTSLSTLRICAGGLTALTLGASLAACGNTEPAEDTESSGEVTLMAYSGVVQDNYTEAVVEPFMEKYPDIDVEYVPAESSSEMLATLRAEQSAPTTDVAIMDISVAATGNSDGIFQPLDPEQVPNMADMAERGQVEDDYRPRGHLRQPGPALQHRRTLHGADQLGGPVG